MAVGENIVQKIRNECELDPIDGNREDDQKDLKGNTSDPAQPSTFQKAKGYMAVPRALEVNVKAA